VSSVQSSLKGDAALVAAGVVYGISTLFRSNGLISGLLFAVEAVTSLLGVLQQRKLQHARRLIAALVGGICVAAGSIVPQFLAWRLYCGDEDTRPWCSNLVPSVYSFVQEAYW
jgi:phosphatidylinositol glycan class V